MPTDVKTTIGVGVVCFAAGALLATKVMGRRSQIFTQCIDEQIDDLMPRWQELKNTIEHLKDNNLVQDTAGKLTVGARARLASFEDVANSSLWDTENSQYCGLVGLIKAIDADGDVEITLDNGGTITTDIKFVTPLQMHKPLRQQVGELDGPIRKMMRVREQRGPSRSTFAVDAM